MKNINWKIILWIAVGLIAIYLIYRIMFKKQRLVNLAKQELNFFAGRNEQDPAVASRLADYWNKGAGWNWISVNNVDTVDNEQPWSSAGLSYVVKKVFPEWPAASSHSKYTLWAKERRANGQGSMIAYKPDEYAPVPGDIIVKRRGSFKGTLESLYPGATSHGDIVISNSNGKVRAIGFNLGNTVKEVEYPAPNGFLTASDHFAVIKM